MSEKFRRKNFAGVMPGKIITCAKYMAYMEGEYMVYMEGEYMAYMELEYMAYMELEYMVYMEGEQRGDIQSEDNETEIDFMLVRQAIVYNKPGKMVAQR